MKAPDEDPLGMPVRWAASGGGAGEAAEVVAGVVIAAPHAAPRTAGRHRDAGEVEQMLARLDDHLRGQHDLCRRLETIADALPDGLDRHETLRLAGCTLPLVRRAHDFEELVLFPLLRIQDGEDSALMHTLDRLQLEHWEDECYAEELSEALACFVQGRDECRAETLGYMLRGFFEGMRRHLAFESEHLVPLARDLLVAHHD